MEKLDKINILIVEDDLIIAENLKEVLQDLGYAVAEPCTCMDEALTSMKIENFDLAILDINLKGKDEGITIGEKIRSEYKIPFIFLTAFADPKTIAAAAETKPSAYLVKPVSSLNLFASIQIALQNFRNNQEATPQTKNEREKDFFIKVGNKISKINWEEVICINAGKNYVTLQIGKEHIPDYPIRSSLLNVITDLIPLELKECFIQINRSQYFNIKFVNEIIKESIISSFGNFEIGEKYKKDLMVKLNII